MRLVALVLLLAAPLAAQPDSPPFAGVDVRDLATRHYYNPFDGLLLDRNPYPQDLIDDAESLVAHLKESPGALEIGTVFSVRALAWTPGQLEVLAIGSANGKPAVRRATFHAAGRTLEGGAPVTLAGASLFVSLAGLTLRLSSADGSFVLVNPIGAGGYRDEESHALMTPPMRPEVTRTPGLSWMDRGKYKGTARGHGYMIPSRTHPDYYEGLPFVRLRRFDQSIDEYGLHGPISRNGTFGLPPLVPGEQVASLRRLALRMSKDPEALADRLAADGLLDPDARLVRGRISNGCIRMRARDIRELYALLNELPAGAPVTVSHAADPAAAHPFPWESRRFAIATNERDEDGLTVMYTGEIRKTSGRPAGALPYPDETDIAAAAATAEKAVRSVARRPPADYVRMRQALAPDVAQR